MRSVRWISAKSSVSIALSSQNENVRFDQSRNVLLKKSTLLTFLERRQGGRRGPTEDEATRDQATPPNRTSLGGEDQPEASGGSGGIEYATDAAADETSEGGRRAGHLASATRKAIEPADRRQDPADNTGA